MNAQGIEWKNAEGEFQYYDDEFEKWMSRIAKIILDVVCALLFTVSARIMFSDVYYWAPFKFNNFIGLLIIGIIVSSVIDLVPLIEGISKIKAYGVFFAVGIFICAGSLFLWGDWEKNSTEISNMVSLYLQDCVKIIPENSGVEYLDYNANKIMIDGSIVNLLTAIIFFVLMCSAKFFRQNIILIVFPIFVIVLEMIRGFYPEYEGLLYLFAGIISAKAVDAKKVQFVLAPGRKYINMGSLRFFWWAILIVGVVLGGNIVKFSGTSLAKSAIKYGEPILDFYENVINGVDSTFIHKSFDEERDYNKVHLDNETPKYDYIDVMEVKTDFMPVGDLYFKSFSANTYKDGKWTNETDKLKELWAEYGYNYQSMSENVLALNAMVTKDYYGVASFSDLYLGGKVTLKYLVDMGEKVHLPYFVELIDGVTAEDDIRYRKERNLYEVSFYTWVFEGDLDSKLGFGRNIMAWQQQYGKFVSEEYTKVPDDMTVVKEIADEILQNTSYKRGDEKIWVDKYREDIVFEVAKWLENNTAYNLYLPKLPKNADPVEYFLGESRTGYCMHYASAATLLLRELGIPARYASGYVVRADGFEKSIKEFSTIVRDDYAHAWVEIYMSGVGWVPYEVTQGQNEAVIEYWEKNEQAGSDVGDNSGNVDNGIGNSDIVPDNENKDDADKKDSKHDDKSDNKKESNNVVKTVVVMVLSLMFISAFVGVCILLMKYYGKRFGKRLADEREKENTVTVIKMINRRLYNKMLLSGKLRKVAAKDDEYKVALVENYEEIPESDWEKYMDIVKAAAFSKREFSVEEMEFCFDIYLKVSLKSKKEKKNTMES